MKSNSDNTKLKQRNKKGDGSISKRSNGTYYGRITLTGYDTYHCYGKTEREVKIKMDEYKKKILRGEKETKKIIVSDYIQEWLENFKKPVLRPSSFDRLEDIYRCHIVNNRIGRYQIGNITTSDIQKLINEKKEVLSYSSIKKIYNLINSCFKHAVITRDLAYNPAEGVLLPKQSTMRIKTKSIQILNNDEMQSLIETADMCYTNGKLKYVYGYAFILIANTGIRVGEALCLRWSSIDLDKKIMHIIENTRLVKNRSQNIQGTKLVRIIGDVKTETGNRQIPLNQTALTAISNLKNYQEMNNIDTEYIISTNKGTIVEHGNFQRAFDIFLKAANVKHIGFHSLRHTFATNLIENGIDVRVVSQLLGHSSVKITYDTYVHPSTASAMQAVSTLDS